MAVDRPERAATMDGARSLVRALRGHPAVTAVCGLSFEAVVFGTLLSLLRMVLVPQILLFGYLGRVFRAQFDGEPMPGFGDFGEVFRTGLRVSVIWVAFASLPALVVFWATQDVRPGDDGTVQLPAVAVRLDGRIHRPQHRHRR